GAVESTITPITWDGTAWSNGTGPEETSDVTISGNYDTEVNGSLTTDDLIVSPSATIIVGAGEFIEVTGDLENNGEEIIIESGGSLVTHGDVSGTNFTFLRATTFNRTTGRYSIVGSPVEGADFSVLGPNAVIYGYDETELYNPDGNEGADRYKTPAALGHATMQSGVGYFSAKTGDENGLISFSGTPNHQTISVDLSLTDHPADEDAFEGFNLVSNPYPCAVTYDNFIDGNINDIETAIYLWDDFNSVVDRGSNADYVVINELGNVDSRQSGLSRWDGSIRSMQGFYVQAKSTGDNTVDFKDEMKITSNNKDAGYYRATDENTSFKLVLENENGNYSETLIGMREDATMESDRYDARLFTPTNTMIYSMIVSEPHAIQGLPIVTSAAEVALGINTEHPGQHIISLDEMEYTDGYNIILRDHMLDRSVNLSSGQTYSFTSLPGSTTTRFSLEIGYEVTEAAPVIVSERAIYMNESRNLVVRTSDQEKIRSIELINMSGQRQSLQAVQVSSVEWRTESIPESGVFIVRLATDSGSTVTKIILK
ncbi:MAG: T9SS type A sorting domain-containing protein, partial [Cyclobacteriaceae bacterium]